MTENDGLTAVAWWDGQGGKTLVRSEALPYLSENAAIAPLCELHFALRLISQRDELVKELAEALRYALPVAEEEWGQSHLIRVRTVGTHAIELMRAALAKAPHV